jgi:hypothetical protein
MRGLPWQRLIVAARQSGMAGFRVPVAPADDSEIVVAESQVPHRVGFITGRSG